MIAPIISRDYRRFIFIRYEMPTVLIMRVFLDYKLSFRLLWLNIDAVRRVQMPHNACKGHRGFRYALLFVWQPAQIHIHVQLCLAGTSMYQRCRVAKGILRVPNRRCSRYPHAGRQNAVYCQTLERRAFIKKSKTCILELWYFKTKQHSLTLQKFPYHISFLKYRQNL